MKRMVELVCQNSDHVPVLSVMLTNTISGVCRSSDFCHSILSPFHFGLRICLSCSTSEEKRITALIVIKTSLLRPKVQLSATVRGIGPSTALMDCMKRARWPFPSFVYFVLHCSETRTDLSFLSMNQLSLGSPSKLTSSLNNHFSRSCRVEISSMSLASVSSVITVESDSTRSSSSSPSFGVLSGGDARRCNRNPLFFLRANPNLILKHLIFLVLR